MKSNIRSRSKHSLFKRFQLLMILETAIACLIMVSCKTQITDRSEEVSITGDTPWIISEEQSEPMLRALDDVKSDWYKVFGRTPIVLKQRPATWKGAVIYFGQKGEWRSSMIKEPFPGPESFVLRLRKDENGRPALVATGADMRGSIYAAYALSEEILGVDPWYYWVDKKPLVQSSINIPSGFNKQFGSPTFKYRGWFINDEDLLHGFKPDPIRENVFSLEMYDHIYETILRLRGNMVVPATFFFPDERCNELAARRGLAINMHHALVVGLNAYRWPKDIPFSYRKHPDIMINYWQTCIDALKDYEVVWTVGYRGKFDSPFWNYESGYESSEARGKIISSAIAKQVELIRNEQPNATIIANMWSEGKELYRQGHISLPEGVILVWPDSGGGVMRDEGQVQAGQGIYYHTAYMGRSNNQLTEMVNPDIIYNQIGRFIRAGATEYILVNVSDIRPVPMTTDCVMKLVWDAAPYLDKTDEQNMTDFLVDWSRRQFGPVIADKIGKNYEQYFKIPYMNNDFFGEALLHTKLYHLYRRAEPLISAGKPISDTVLLDMCTDLEKLAGENIGYVTGLFTQAESIYHEIPEKRREFYQSHVLAQIQIQLQSLIIMDAYCKSLLAYDSGNRSDAISYAQKAFDSCGHLFSELRKAEYGKWSVWYMGESFTNLNRTYEIVRQLLAQLKGQPAPPARKIHGKREYKVFCKYQEPFLENFPLLYGSER
ncbi:MAG: glycosyl hydrolase 115 family protein [Cytophagales bacterium]|nr:glycosyl hydrolase 115 family protein [Cytophagales bacterium]